MSLIALIGGLSRDEKLAALDLIWEQLASDPISFVSPAWHEDVIATRLADPDPTGRLPLSEAKLQIEESLHARRASGQSP